MNFIKSIWNRITAFFGNLFGSKKDVTKVETNATVKAEATIAANDAHAEAESAKAERMEKLAVIFNRIIQHATFRNYSLEETRAAFYAEDEKTMLRIEREMKARTYKAPSKNKVVKMRKPVAKTVAA